jgi:CubicO group peptidase (beta-lactamase class C family)
MSHRFPTRAQSLHLACWLVTSAASATIKTTKFLNSKHYDNVIASLAIFQDDPLVSPPGTKFNYSRYGFNLLSAVIEKACAEDFLSCMRDLVFSPLGLRSTVADQPSELIEQRARFYTHWKDKPLENAAYTDNGYKWAGGGFLSSSEDLVRFGNALLEPVYLKKESLALLFTSQKIKSGEETGYGMGWGIEKSKSGKRIFAHSGGATGASAQLILYPDEHLVVAMVAITNPMAMVGNSNKCSQSPRRLKASRTLWYSVHLPSVQQFSINS